MRRKSFGDRSRERILDQVVESTPDAIYVKDLRGRYRLFNAAAESVTGLRRSAVLGSDDRSVFSSVDAQEIMTRDRLVIDTKEPRSFEEKIHPASGVRIFSSTKGPLFDERGQIIGIYGIAREITEQKRQEALRREAEERLRLFIDHAPAAIAMFDDQMRYLAVSRRYIEDYRLSDSDLAGKSHYELFPEIGQRWRNVHERILRGAVEKCDADPFPREDGSLDWVKWEMRPWTAADGSVGGAVLFSEIITEKKMLEDALREEVQLRDEFLSIASHELKTPLVAIQMQLDLAGRLLDGESAPIGGSVTPLELLNGARRSVLNLGHLLEQLLDVSRIRAGKLSLRKSNVELNSIAREAIAAVEELARRKGSKIDWRDGPPIWGNWDPGRLGQVFGNLLSNAIKYGEGKPISVRLETLPDARWARLSVQDHGTGIPPEFLGRLFKRFERGRLSGQADGLGLGLFIVDQIVTAHGGRILVDSAPGRGSTFKVELPLGTD